MDRAIWKIEYDTKDKKHVTKLFPSERDANKERAKLKNVSGLRVQVVFYDGQG